jgi:CBS domain-containing protein
MPVIARDLMTPDVVTVTPDLSIKAFAELLVSHRISGAPVLDAAGALVGVATESDLIFRDAAVHLPTVITLLDAYFVLGSPRKHDQELHKLLGQTVGEIMSTDLVTVGPEATLQEMATIMHERRRHLLPVVSDGKLIGVVGKADLVRGIAQEE